MLVAVALLLATAACGSDDAKAAEDDPAAWKAYDAKMATWVECLKANGLTEVRYRGHSTAVMNPKMEVEGIPTEAWNSHAAWDKCRPQQPTDSDRPVPFVSNELPPELLQEERAVAKCLRGKGFTDYPDPEAKPDPAKSPTRYDNQKENPIPGLDQAWKDCRRELGLKDQAGG